ncbi:MAG: nucleotidyltransferase family protein [Pseudomonadota bacterium]
MQEPRSPREGHGGTGVIALVMAAGASRRFGDADKRVAALHDGRTLLAATVAGLCSGFSDVRVVIGNDDSPAALNLPGTVPVIRAPNAARGMGSSIADAVHALGGERASAVAICLGDMPWIQAPTLALLASHAAPDRILRPVYHGQPGHPVLFGRTFLPALAGLSGDTGARPIIQRYPGASHTVSVDDPSILADLDHPTSLHAQHTDSL